MRIKYSDSKNFLNSKKIDRWKLLTIWGASDAAS